MPCDCNSSRFQHSDDANGLLWRLLLCLLGWRFQCPLENSVTLYTVMIWFRDQSISMVLLSDNNDHEKTTVVPYTAYVFNYIKEHFEDNVHDIEIWTDGPSSQFRNKYIFEFIGITLPQLIAYNVFWNYSATSHGKVAVDVVGGTIKWVVTQALVTRKAILKDAVSMFNAVKEKTKLHLAVMTQEYVESTLWDLGMHILWQDSALPGTMHIHQVEQIDKWKVSTCMFYSDWSCTIHSLNSVEYQSLTSIRTQMSTLEILSLWNMKVNFTWEKFFIWYQTSQQQ